jgi:lambda family phage tail tape measure protein
LEFGNLAMVDSAIKADLILRARQLDAENAANDARAENMAKQIRLGKEDAKRIEVYTAMQEQRRLDELERAAQQENEVQEAWTRKTLEDQERRAKQAQQVWENFIQNVQGTLGDQLYQAMQGNFSNIGQAFSQMLQRMLAEALAANLMRAMFGGSSVGGLASIFMAGAGGPAVAIARGAAFDHGMMAFASGGIVDMATPFRFGAGGSRLGVMGEAGPEAILPLKRDSSGRLGVASGGQRSIVVNHEVNINIDSRTDRAEVRRLTENAIKLGNADLVEKLSRAGAIG